MTNEDWQWVQKRWFFAYSFRFEVDGYQITLEKGITTTGQIEYAIFINDWFKGEWARRDCEERRRFLRREVHKVHTAKEMKVWRRWKGRSYKNPTFEVYTPFWRSFRSFKRHLVANNQEIRLVRPEELQGLHISKDEEEKQCETIE